jgi:transposase-like protein
MKKKKPKSYSTDLKPDAARRMTQATSIAGLAKELGIRRKLLYQWCHEFEAEDRARSSRSFGKKLGEVHHVSKSAAFR